MNQTQSKALLISTKSIKKTQYKEYRKSRANTLKFSFGSVTPKDVLAVISALDDIKTSVRDIPLRILKENKIF